MLAWNFWFAFVIRSNIKAVTSIDDIKCPNLLQAITALPFMAVNFRFNRESRGIRPAVKTGSRKTHSVTKRASEFTSDAPVPNCHRSLQPRTSQKSADVTKVRWRHADLCRTPLGGTEVYQAICGIHLVNDLRSIVYHIASQHSPILYGNSRKQTPTNAHISALKFIAGQA